MAVRRGTPPYETTVHARVCDCRQEPMRLGRSHDPGKAIRLISGYWNVYLAFYGDQMVWLYFQVIDTRDGTVIWRNGRHLHTPGGTLDIQDEDHPDSGGH